MKNHWLQAAALVLALTTTAVGALVWIDSTYAEKETVLFLFGQILDRLDGLEAAIRGLGR